jgi:hypothetical protein
MPQSIIWISAQAGCDGPAHQPDFFLAPSGQSQCAAKHAGEIEYFRSRSDVGRETLNWQWLASKQGAVDTCQAFLHATQERQVASWIGIALARIALQKLLNLALSQHRVRPESCLGISPLALQRFRRSTIRAVRAFDLKKYEERLATEPVQPILGRVQLDQLQQRRKALLAWVAEQEATYGEAIWAWE